MSRKFIPPSLARQNLGSLIVQISSEQLLGPLTPLSNIQVTIKGISPNGEATTLAQLTTNSVGQTDPIELEAPPIELSLDPENTNMPYSTYRIETSSPDYVDAVVNGTQVFTDTRSIQPISLEPTVRSSLSRGSFMRELTESITIGPATLYGNYPEKIPEASIKPILPGSGFITLDSVIVPEYVIVHAGSPNDNSAPNYTVPFVDYISNVASCEIYPTWPTETIRANIIAITSFTLNRVYTEWYRNKGKPYAITNSTAYDHAFFYGRNIFDSIVDVTADVFDVYIKRGDFTQPLLSQYCDGVKSSCPNWMTQSLYVSKFLKVISIYIDEKSSLYTSVYISYFLFYYTNKSRGLIFITFITLLLIFLLHTYNILNALKYFLSLYTFSYIEIFLFKVLLNLSISTISIPYSPSFSIPTTASGRTPSSFTSLLNLMTL